MTEPIELNAEQSQAVKEIIEKIKSGQKLVTLGGYAGTGKTTLVKFLIEELREIGYKKLSFCAFTGKAASVLESKITDIMEFNDSCGTIHSLIYIPVIYKGQVVSWDKTDFLENDLIIIDEASMVTKNILEDLSSYGKPIIAIGDHGQLPPIADKFSLMQNPQIKLETIVRQAEDNPIIKLSMMARVDGFIPYGEYGESIKKIKCYPFVEEMKPAIADMIVCGTNRTRIGINARMRKLHGFKSITPVKGDKVICLKNNNDEQLFNGMIGYIKQIKEKGKHWYEASILINDDFVYKGMISKYQFNAATRLTEFPAPYKDFDCRLLSDLFDFAYCITTHKSQGSEADTVYVVEERFSRMSDDDWKRWLYTAVTRAKKNLYIIGRN